MESPAILDAAANSFNSFDSCSLFMHAKVLMELKFIRLLFGGLEIISYLCRKIGRNMERYFNTAGPNRPEFEYTVDPLGRFDLDEILSLIGQGKYFVLHAPRQTGKTSCARRADLPSRLFGEDH